MSKTRLTLDNRINLQAAINKNYSLEECAILLKKSRSTIYREIVNNSYYKQCRHTCAHCSKSCPVLKPFVNGECKEFHAYRCERWNKFPYTCNGCEHTQYCTHLKRYYDCIEADETSKRNRIEPRVYSKFLMKICTQWMRNLFMELEIMDNHSITYMCQASCFN